MTAPTAPLRPEERPDDESATGPGSSSDAAASRPTRRSRLVSRTPARPLGWGLALIGAGVLWLLAAAGLPIRWELVLPVTLLLLGLLVLVAGRRWSVEGLVGLTVVVALVALIAPVTPGPAVLSAGNRVHAPVERYEVPADYALGTGSLTIDLRELPLANGTTEIAATVVFGELVVRVPDDVTITGRSRATIGQTFTFGEQHAGLAPAMTFAEAGVAPDDPDASTLDLDLQVVFGRIEVTR